MAVVGGWVGGHLERDELLLVEVLVLDVALEGLELSTRPHAMTGSAP